MKTIHVDCWQDVIDAASFRGWEEPEAEGAEWSPRDADEFEAAAIEYLNRKGFDVVYADDEWEVPTLEEEL